MKYILLIVSISCSSCVWYDPWRTENYKVSEVFPSDLFYSLEHGHLKKGDLIIYPVFVPTISEKDIRTGPYKFVINFVDHSGLIDFIEICGLKIFGASDKALLEREPTACLRGITKSGKNISVVLAENLEPNFSEKEELYVIFKLRFRSKTKLESIDAKIRFTPYTKKGRFVMDA